jgi:hypothetical protein
VNPPNVVSDVVTQALRRDAKRYAAHGPRLLERSIPSIGWQFDDVKPDRTNLGISPPWFNALRHAFTQALERRASIDAGPRLASWRRSRRRRRRGRWFRLPRRLGFRWRLVRWRLDFRWRRGCLDGAQPHGSKPPLSKAPSGVAPPPAGRRQRDSCGCQPTTGRS